MSISDLGSGQNPAPAGIILVTDQNHRLLGIATDGDIRRALARGISLTAPIGRIMNVNPFLIEGQKSKTEILLLVAEKAREKKWYKDRINKIIIVDKNRRVLDIVSFYDLWRASDLRFKRIGVVGLGYVGLTLALTLADLGFKVLGKDASAKVASSLKKSKPHFFEDGLAVLLKDHLGKNFRVVDNFAGENGCDIYFIAVGTPIEKNQKSDLSALEKSAESLGLVLKRGDAVILRSTVPVGATRNTVVPILEKISGLKAGEDFFVAFAPERTVEGKALEELRTLPQVIGGINHASMELAVNIFSFMTRSTVLVDSLEEAEIVKLINNSYRDVTFAFANEVALICHQYGIDTQRVIQAANRDYERSRVPLPSPGVGGACLEKDPIIFTESARAKNYDPRLIRNSRLVNGMMVDFVGDQIVSFLKNRKSGVKNPKVFIMGFAFKGRPVTSDTRGSTTIPVLQKIRKYTKNVYGYDPMVKRSDILSHKVKHISEPERGFAGADAVLVMNNNPEFSKLEIRKLLRLANKPSFLFDSWGLYDLSEVAKVSGITYKRL